MLRNYKFESRATGMGLTKFVSTVLLKFYQFPCTVVEKWKRKRKTIWHEAIKISVQLAIIQCESWGH